jgi:sulfate permease, SulP family
MQDGFNYTLRCLLAALVLSIINLTFIISSTALIFQGHLTSYFQLGMAVLLLSYGVTGLIMSFASSLPGLIVAPKEVLIAILSFISAHILAAAPPLNPGDALATLLVCMGLTTFLSGLFFYLMGRFRLAALIRFIPFPLIAGFFISVGVLLVEISFTVMTGAVISPKGLPGLSLKTITLWGPGLVFGLTAFFISRRTEHYLTIPLLTGAGIAATFLAAAWFSLSLDEMQSMGLLLKPTGTGPVLPRPIMEFVTTASWTTVLEQWPRMLSLVLLASLSVLLFISITEVGVDREIQLERDLKAVSLGNMASGLFGGVVVMHEPIDTGITRRLGADGRLVGVFFSFFCLLLLLVGWRIVPFFPRPVMGGLILFIGLSLFWENLRAGWRRMARPEFGLVCLIAAAVVGLGFLWGLAMGLLAAILLFVVNLSRIDSIKAELSGSTVRSRMERSLPELELLEEQGRSVRIFILQGYLFFGTAERILDRIRAGLPARPGEGIGGGFLILDFREVTGMDSSALNVFRKLVRAVGGTGTVLILTGLRPLIQRQLKAVGVDEGPGLSLFPSLDLGLSWCEEALLETGRAKKTAPALERLLLEIFGSPERARLFRSLLQPLHLEENELLFESGAEADSFYLIETGGVNAEVPGSDGVSTRLRGMGPGSVFGEIGLYGEPKRTARVTADRPTVLLRMKFQRFRELEKEQPALTQSFHKHIIRTMSHRMARDSRDPWTV